MENKKLTPEQEQDARGILRRVDPYEMADARPLAKALLSEIDRLRAIVDQVDDELAVNWVNVKEGNYEAALRDLVTFNTHVSNDPAVNGIDAAIDNERERCARIAESWNVWGLLDATVEWFKSAAEATAAEIAGRIRSAEDNSEPTGTNNDLIPASAVKGVRQTLYDLDCQRMGKAYESGYRDALDRARMEAGSMLPPEDMLPRILPPAMNASNLRRLARNIEIFNSRDHDIRYLRQWAGYIEELKRLDESKKAATVVCKYCEEFGMPSVSIPTKDRRICPQCGAWGKFKDELTSTDNTTKESL